MYMEEFAPDAGIVVLCIIVGLVLKWAFKGKEQLVAGIPWMLAVCGGILGVIQGLTINEGLHEYTIIAQGVVSGLAACGCYQVVHQQMKLKLKDAEDKAQKELNEMNNEHTTVMNFDQFNDFLDKIKLGGPFVGHLLDTVLNKDKSSDSDEDEE